MDHNIILDLVSLITEIPGRPAVHSQHSTSLLCLHVRVDAGNFVAVYTHRLYISRPVYNARVHVYKYGMRISGPRVRTSLVNDKRSY